MGGRLVHTTVAQGSRRPLQTLWLVIHNSSVTYERTIWSTLHPNQTHVESTIVKASGLKKRISFKPVGEMERCPRLGKKHPSKNRFFIACTFLTVAKVS